MRPRAFSFPAVKLVRLFVLALAVALGAIAFVRRPQLPPAERGRRLAEREGCFACHGPGGRNGPANHGRTDKTVPGWAGDLMMYAKNRDDVRDWIEDGAPERRRASASWRDARAKGVYRMPAFGRRLSRSQIDDLTAYVLAVNGSPSPAETLATRGLERAQALGCTGCHGAGGRLALPNLGSRKGYVPSWDGRDWPELVQDRAEFDGWVRHGVSDRFKGNPPAMFFLRRARLHMPAFEDHLAEGDLDALWAYVQWLRSDAALPEAADIE